MGPLHGIRIIEVAALGPAPMGAMILADLGAEVVRIERKLAPGAKPASELFDPAIDILNRNRRVVTLDLKKPEGLAAARQLIAAADGLIRRRGIARLRIRRGRLWLSAPFSCPILLGR